MVVLNDGSDGCDTVHYIDEYVAKDYIQQITMFYGRYKHDMAVFVHDPLDKFNEAETLIFLHKIQPMKLKPLLATEYRSQQQEKHVTESSRYCNINRQHFPFIMYTNGNIFTEYRNILYIFLY